MTRKTSRPIIVEQVDDIPVVYGMLERMGIQEAVDSFVKAHGNWVGLSPGWVITIWLVHILHEQNHLMEPVQTWVEGHKWTLRKLTGEKIRPLDFADDRLALCLHYISTDAVWELIEERLGQRLIRVYDLETGCIRLDATVGTVYHNPAPGHLFQIGKAKNGQYATQFKLMMSSLDPLGLPLVADVEPGNRADDPLYIPSYQRTKQIVQRSGLLVVGDSKMGSLATRATIVAGQDMYLTPLKEDRDFLASLLEVWLADGAESTPVFLPADQPRDGSPPDPKLAIAHGFATQRPQQAMVEGQDIVWDERLLVICSYSYQKSERAGLLRRLDKAEAGLLALTPPPGRGKTQIPEESLLRHHIAQVEKRYRVQGFFEYDIQRQVTERQVHRYKDKPPRRERKVRYQLDVTRNQEAIDKAQMRMGWRIYATNAPQAKLSLSQALLAYRGQIGAENIFRRLHGKFLSVTPLYVQRQDHARGLIHLLTLAARLLALGDYVARQALAAEKSQLAGVYTGNAKRSTARPTMERMLKAYEGIHLLLIPQGERRIAQLTALTTVQERILDLLGLSYDLFTRLETA